MFRGVCGRPFRKTRTAKANTPFLIARLTQRSLVAQFRKRLQAFRLVMSRIGGTCALERRAMVLLILDGLLLTPSNSLGSGLPVHLCAQRLPGATQSLRGLLRYRISLYYHSPFRLPGLCNEEAYGLPKLARPN